MSTSFAVPPLPLYLAQDRKQEPSLPLVSSTPQMDAAQKALRACRDEIDAIDDGILKALNLRAQAVQRLAAIKRQNTIAVFDHGREQQVMQRVSTCENTLPPERRRAIFTTILEQMREWQLVLNQWTED